jgi:hypothetical protein
MNEAGHENFRHRQGDRWTDKFFISANITGKDCRFSAYTSDKVKVISCDTEDGTMTLEWDPIYSVTSRDGTVFTGLTILTPIISKVQSAALPSGELYYDLENYEDGDTYMTGKLTIDKDTTT